MNDEDYAGMLDELLDIDDDSLTDWEVEFIEDMALVRERGGLFTQGQANKLQQIYDERR